MLRDEHFETGQPVSSCGRLPSRTMSQCDEVYSGNFDSSETDAAGEQRSIDRPAFSSFSSQQGESRHTGGNTFCKDVAMYSGGSAFATGGDLSDDSDDDDQHKTMAQPTRLPQSQQYTLPLLERNSMQELFGILLSTGPDVNQVSLRPSPNGDGNGNRDRGHSVNSQTTHPHQHQSYQHQSNDPPPLQQMDSNHLPDLGCLLQSLGSRSHPYGVGLVSANVIQAQLVLNALVSDEAEAEGTYMTEVSEDGGGDRSAAAAESSDDVGLNATLLQQLQQQQYQHADSGLDERLEAPGTAWQRPTSWLAPASAMPVALSLRLTPGQPWPEASEVQQQQQRTMMTPQLPHSQLHSMQPQPLPLLSPQQLPSAAESDLARSFRMLPLTAADEAGNLAPEGRLQPNLSQMMQLQQNHQQLLLRLQQQQQQQEYGGSWAQHATGANPSLSSAILLQMAGHERSVATATTVDNCSRGPRLEARPSFTGNNDELIAAMAAAMLGSTTRHSAAAAANATASTLNVPAGALAAGATAAGARPADDTALRVDFNSYAATTNTVTMRTSKPGYGVAGAAAVGGHRPQHLQLQLPVLPPSSGVVGSRQRGHDSYGARSSSSGMADFHDEAAVAATLAGGGGGGGGTAGSVPGSLCGSAPGTPHASPFGDCGVTRPVAPWSASSSTRSLQSYNMAPTQPQEPQQQQSYLRSASQTYGHAAPSPELGSSNQLRRHLTGSSSNVLIPGGVAAAAAGPSKPTISVADGIANASGALLSALPPAAATFHDGRTSISGQPISSLAFALQNTGLGNDRRDTASGALSGADCSSGGPKFTLNRGGGGGGSGSGGNMNSNASLSGGDGSISGCGLSGLTLGSERSGSISGSAAAASKRSRPQQRRSATSQQPASGVATTVLQVEEDFGGGGASSGGEGDDDGGGSGALGAQRIWQPEELPPPVAVMVMGLSREVGDDGRRRRISVQGVFHPDRYMSNQDCILYENRFISRSAFEKTGGSTTAKWHCSIKVVGTNVVTLGSWLSTKGLPVLKGGSRKSKRQRAVEQSAGSPSPCGQLNMFQPSSSFGHQSHSQPHPQQPSPVRMSSDNSLKSALMLSTVAAPSTTTTNPTSTQPGGTVSVSASGCSSSGSGMSGFSLATWSNVPPQQQQQQYQRGLQPSVTQLPLGLPLMSQETSQSLTRLQSQSQPSQTYPPQQQQGQGQGQATGMPPSGCVASRPAFCQPLSIPPLKQQQHHQTHNNMPSTPPPTPIGGVSLPPRPPSLQLYPPSALQLDQMTSPQSRGLSMDAETAVRTSQRSAAAAAAAACAAAAAAAARWAGGLDDGSGSSVAELHPAPATCGVMMGDRGLTGPEACASISTCLPGNSPAGPYLGSVFTTGFGGGLERGDLPSSQGGGGGLGGPGGGSVT